MAGLQHLRLLWLLWLGLLWLWLGLGPALLLLPPSHPRLSRQERRRRRHPPHNLPSLLIGAGRSRQGGEAALRQPQEEGRDAC